MEKFGRMFAPISEIYRLGERAMAFSIVSKLEE